MTARDIEILSGWSRAKVYRIIKDEDFPIPREVGRRIKWESTAIIEWITIYNLRATMGRQGAARFEEELATRANIDPLVRTAIGRAMAREMAIR